MKLKRPVIATGAAACLAGVSLLGLNMASAGAGQNGYPTTTTYPHHKPPPTSTTYPHQTTTTYPHQTTTTFPVETTTTAPEETTTTAPEETTTTLPEETTTTLPGETTTTLPGVTTTTAPGQIRTLLSLRAVVIGGPATPADFDLTARGPIDISGITDNPRVTRALVDPGTYALGFIEDARAMDPYTNSGFGCVGSADFTPVSTTLDAGEAAICTIVFTEAATTGTTVPGTPAPTGSTPASSGTTTGGTVAVLAPGAPITAPSTPAPGCPAQDPQCPASGRGLG